MKKILTSLFFFLGIALAFPVGVSATTGFAGFNWTPHESQRLWTSIASSADGTKLAAVVNGDQIYTSIDSGTTWTVRDSSRSWTGIASSADGTKLVAIVANGRIYTSVDSGVTWTARESTRDWYSVSSSADGTKLIAGLRTGGQLYVSGDSGLTWVARGPSGMQWWHSVASSADGTKLAAVGLDNGSGNNGTLSHLYISSDSGVTWAARGPALCGILCGYVTSSSDGTKLALAVGTDQIYTSTDSGLTWTGRGPSGGLSWRAIASSADGTKLVAGVDGGLLYTSTDSGVTWTTSDSSRYWSSVASSADGSKLVAIDRNNGQIYTGQFVSETVVCPVSWTERANQSTGRWLSVASSADGSKLVAGTLNGTGGGVYTSNDSGATWSLRNSGSAMFYVASSADGTRVIATQGAEVYVSTDSGVTWNSGTQLSGGTILNIVSSADGMKLAVNQGSVAFIRTSVDGGITWTDRSQSLQRLAMSASGDKLFGINTSTGNFFTSTDFGATFVDRGVVGSGRMYASNDGTKIVVLASSGLRVSVDSGVTWATRMPNESISWVFMSPDGTKLFFAKSNGFMYLSTDMGLTAAPTGTSIDLSDVASPIASSFDGSKLAAASLNNFKLYTASACGGPAGTVNPHNMLGYAWSSTIGWLSFSCNNDNSCGTVDYGVNYDSSTGDIAGYAWSPNVGWVQFGGLSGFPTGSGTSPLNAKISGSNMMGWAKALSAEDAGWDGWISLNGTGYGVTKIGAALSGFSWASSVIGWLSFDGVTVDDSGSTFDAKVNGTSVNGSASVAGNSTVSLVATLGTLPSGTTCSISKTSSGGTALSPLPSASSTVSWTITTAALSGPAAYSYALTCDNHAGYSNTKTVSFSVLLAVPEFSIGGPEEIGVQFIRSGNTDSQIKIITVYPTNFTGNVNISLAGISHAVHASTTILYSIGGGTFSANPSSVSVAPNGATTFRIRLSQPIQDICKVPGSNIPAGCVDYYITLNATDASSQGAPQKTKVYRINQAPVDAKFKEI